VLKSALKIESIFSAKPLMCIATMNIYVVFANHIPPMGYNECRGAPP